MKVVSSYQSLPEGALRKLPLHFCFHLKEVRIVAFPFYLYNIRLEEYFAIKSFNGSMCSQSPTSNSPDVVSLKK